MKEMELKLFQIRSIIPSQWCKYFLTVIKRHTQDCIILSYLRVVVLVKVVANSQNKNKLARLPVPAACTSKVPPFSEAFSDFPLPF